MAACLFHKIHTVLIKLHALFIVQRQALFMQASVSCPFQKLFDYVLHKTDTGKNILINFPLFLYHQSIFTVQYGQAINRLQFAY